MEKIVDNEVLDIDEVLREEMVEKLLENENEKQKLTRDEMQLIINGIIAKYV